MEDFLQGLIQSGLTGNKPQVPLGQPQPQQGGLGQVAKQPAISPDDMLGKEQARLTGDDELSALAKVRDSSKQKLVDELMKQSEYSGLDKIAAGFRGINLGRVPKGMSSLAFAAEGMGDAAGKFAELKDKYKQTALELQATAAQKAYDDQWAQEKQARQNMAAERRASLANETKETIAKAKALAASGKVPPNTMAKLIADAETAVQNDFANGRITNDATERQMTKDKYIAEGIKRILGDEWVNTALPGQPPTSTAPAQSASTPEQGAGFQGDPNTIMKELARIPNEEDKIAAGQQYEQQLNTPPPPPAQSTTGQVTPPTAMTKQQLEVKAERDKQISTGQVKQILDAPAAQVELIGHAAALDQMDQKVDQILASAGLGTATGPILGRLPTLRGTTADTEADILSLKAKTGFAVLQEMRAASKTGGALGNISDKEEALLQNALEPFAEKLQTTEHLQAALEGLKQYIVGAKERAAQAYAIQYGTPVGGGTAQPSAVPVAPSVAPAVPSSAASRLKAFPKDKP